MRHSARLLLPILVMTAACRGEERLQDPSTVGPASLRIGSPGALRHSGATPDGPGPQFGYCSGGCPTDSSVVDFEGGWASGFTSLTTQFAALGVTFDSTVVAQAPGYNSTEYPPRSGTAVATADFTVSGGGSGILYLLLDDAAVRVRGYVTSFSPLTLRCYNASDSLLAESTFPGGNLATVHGGPVNQPLEVSAPGIRSCQFVGPDNQYSVDDLTMVWVEPVPTLVCNSVIRGQNGTCTVTGADSVLQWRFAGVLDSASHLPLIDPTVADTSFAPDTTWVGTAVLTGTVSAQVRYGPGLDTITLAAPWVVQPRTGSEWRWGPANWNLTHHGSRLCGYGDLVQKLVGGVWKFTGQNAGRLAVNRRASSSGCAGGSIEPDVDVFPDSGTTLATGVGGPNDGLHFVLANTYRIDRVTEINDWLDSPVSPVLAVIDTADYRKCWDRLPNPKPLYGSSITRSLFSFNSTCADTGMTTFVARLWDHEEYGTQDSSSLATANGHESRRRLAAIDIANDPRAIVEPLVSKTFPDDLKYLIETAVRAADGRITAIAGDHQKVKDNVIHPVTGSCLGGWILRIPSAPTPRYYVDLQFGMQLPDSTIVCH